MRILILSDIHANLTALEAALAKAEGSYDVAVCLGDIVGYGPDPAEVSEEIRRIAKSSIRGNHDKAVAGLMSTEDFNAVAKAAVDWTRAQLSSEQLKWLAELPQGPKETNGIVLVHGAFQDEDEYVFTPAQALEGLLDSSAPVTFFGHTHHQGGFAYADSNLEVLQIHPRRNESFAPLRIEPDRRYLLNPGSIGQPRDADPRAAYGVGKVQCEDRLFELWGREQLPVTILRVGHTLGPRSAVAARDPMLFARIEAGRPILIPAEGFAALSLVHTKDVARLMASLLGNERVKGEAYNVTSAEVTTIVGVIHLIARAMGKSAEIVEVPMAIARRQNPPLLHWGEAAGGTAILSIRPLIAVPPPPWLGEGVRRLWRQRRRGGRRRAG